MISLIDPAVVERLCPELRSLLEAELARGNRINETNASWGLGNGTVWLLRRAAQHPVPVGVEFRLLDDPHNGHAEYICREHKQVLVSGLST
jgi:hypothetical protein